MNHRKNIIKAAKNLIKKRGDFVSCQMLRMNIEKAMDDGFDFGSINPTILLDEITCIEIGGGEYLDEIEFLIDSLSEK